MMLLRLLALLVGLYATDARAAMCDIRSATPTFADLTTIGLLICDTSGNQRVSLGTLLSGEDQANNVIRIEKQFTTAGVKTDDFQVKASPGFLHCIIISPADGAPTAGQIDIYDNTAESGTKIFHYEVVVTTMFAPIQICPDVVMATGIYLGFTTTADVNVTVSYR